MVVDATDIAEFRRMMGKGVLITGSLRVNGDLLFDDGSILCAREVTCGSATFNECFCSVQQLNAKTYIFVNDCASHGYEVDVFKAKTSVLLYNSASIKNGPVSVGPILNWVREHEVDLSDLVNELGPPDVSRALRSDTPGLLQAVYDQKVAEFLGAYR